MHVSTRVWTDGRSALVWHSSGRYSLDRDGDVVREGPWTPKILALNSVGEDVLEEDRSYEAAACYRDRIAEIRNATLHIGARSVPLNGDAEPIAWPRELFWREERAARWAASSTFVGPFSLTSSPFGLGVGAAGSGHVVVVRDEGEPWSARVPHAIRGRESPAMISTLPTADGAVITLCTMGARRRRAALVFAGANHVQRWPPTECALPVRQAPRLVCCGDQLLAAFGRRVLLFALPSLEEVASLELDHAVDDLCAVDGQVAIASHHSAYWARVEGTAIVVERAWDLLNEPLPQKGTVSWEPEREDGPTNVEAAVQKAEAWSARKGETFTLKLRLRSIGRPGTALRIEASGPAIEEGHVTFTHASSESFEATFETVDGALRAELADVPIPQGYKRPVTPKPKNDVQKERAKELLEASRLDLVLQGTANNNGRALLKLQIGGLEASPFRWTRPFLVEE
ncbi:MAG: hypothetical protein AAGE52_09180 [Myxococcota bacterium]